MINIKRIYLILLEKGKPTMVGGKKFGVTGPEMEKQK